MHLRKGKRCFLFITICGLYSQGSFSADGYLFNVLASNQTLTIHSTIPNHVYSNAGIKINTAGYSLPNAGSECSPVNNGYCLFSTSNTQATHITIAGNAGTISFSLCLNGKSALSCQVYSVQIMEPQQHNVIYIGNSNGDVQYSKSMPDGSSVHGVVVTNTGITTIYAGTSNGNIEISTDGGVSWQPTPTQPDGCAVNGLAVASDGNIYVASGCDNVFVSTNQGLSWTSTATAPSSTPLSLFYKE